MCIILHFYSETNEKIKYVNSIGTTSVQEKIIGLSLIQDFSKYHLRIENGKKHNLRGNAALHRRTRYDVGKEENHIYKYDEDKEVANALHIFTENSNMLDATDLLMSLESLFVSSSYALSIVINEVTDKAVYITKCNVLEIRKEKRR
ncbi:hypothetical protein QE152_g28334 [Popillia japonica]|uniref:Uncharacterized protein n=1 Tax=Popillia japonica TaxID=7064 RepID=A0AAW1JL04_POPJA